MATLESVLASIPGYGGYHAKRQLDQQTQAGQIQQAGALISLQEKMQQAAQEGAFRKDLAALGPEPEQSALAQLAAKYSKPGDVLRSQQSSLDRQATIEASKATREAALTQAKASAEATHEAKMARLSNDAERVAETARHNKVMEQFAAQGGKPPPGYKNNPDGSQSPIPGGPADTKITGAFNADTAALGGLNANIDRLSNAANVLLQHPGLGGITGKRGAFPNIPGSAAANAEAKLTTLKAQVGFGVLQDMRNNSKTGGALGSVTEGEHKLLQNALEALDKAQSEEEMAKSLRGIMTYAEGAKDRLRAAYNLKHKDRIPGTAEAAGGAAVPPAPAPATAAPAAFTKGQTATNAQGVKIEFDGTNWRPVAR